MSEEDKKLQKHLVDEMMKVTESNPDVMIYMQALMKKYEELEQENKELNRICETYSQSLYNADLTKVEAKVEQLENIRKEAIEKLKEIVLYDEYVTIHSDFIYDLLNILNKGSE